MAATTISSDQQCNQSALLRHGVLSGIIERQRSRRLRPLKWTAMLRIRDGLGHGTAEHVGDLRISTINWSN